MIQRKLITCARYALVLSASALFVSGAVAQDEKKADETKKAPKTTAVKKTDKAVEKGDKKDGGTELATGKDKASYGIGINIGRSLKKDGWKVNPE